MTRGWKITVIVVAVVLIASTPVFWKLDGPDTGQLVGASVQAGVGVLGVLLMLLWPTPTAGPVDTAVDTGKAESTDGGSAHTGVRRPGGTGDGSARAKGTGDATAQGQGSSASTGVDYS